MSEANVVEVVLPEISVEAADAATEDLSDLGDSYCSALYDFTLCVGERKLRGEGWVFCGWLPPGAHADLDGSGLTLWGDSQPGGWRCLDGDGQESGRPSVHERWYRPDADEKILVGPTTGGVDVEVEPGMVPAWAQALAEAEAAAGDARDTALERAVEIRAQLIKRIEAALEGMSTPDVEPPDARMVWDELDSLEAAPDLHGGNWRGAGPCSAWLGEDGEPQYRWCPDEDDIAYALRDSCTRMARGILTELGSA